MAKKEQTLFQQVLRYTLVGLASNAIGYFIYLIATYMGSPPKATMTFLYTISAITSYIGNRNFTFSHDGGVLSSSTRYIAVHIVGYLINLALLIIFADILGYAHQWVQGCAIIVVASYLFVTFKYFVFSKNQTPMDM